MKCIFCCKVKPGTGFSDEHVFPEAIGGRLILKNTVCTDCNSQYGHGSDSDLSNHVFSELNRLKYKIKGKSGKVPNPLNNGHVVGKEDHKVKYTMTNDGNPASLFTVTKLEKERIGSGLRFTGHIDGSKATQLEEMVRLACKRNGVVTSEEEFKKLRNLPTISSDQEICIPLTFDLIKYKKGILKIIYELSYYWLGDKYLSDPAAQQIKEILKDQRNIDELEGVYDIRGKIDFIKDQSIFPFWEDNPESHIAFLWQYDRVLMIYVRIFYAFEGFIHISNNPELYKIEEGNFIEIDTKSNRMEESSFLQQLSLRLHRAK